MHAHLTRVYIDPQCEQSTRDNQPPRGVTVERRSNTGPVTRFALTLLLRLEAL